MEFAAFFQARAYGAIGVVAMVLGWTVQMSLQLTKAVSQLESNVDRLQKESTACATDRVDNAKHVASLNEQIALLRQSMEFFGTVLSEVRDSLRGDEPHPHSPVRRAPARKKAD